MQHRRRVGLGALWLLIGVAVLPHAHELQAPTIGQFAIDGGAGLPRIVRVDGDRPVPLYSPDDASTSEGFLRIGNGVYPFSELQILEPLHAREGGFSIAYQGPRNVTVSLSARLDTASPYPDRLILEHTVTNHGRRRQDVALRLVFDTWLGTHTTRPFAILTDSVHAIRDSIARETDVAFDTEGVVASFADEHAPALFGIVLGDGTPPAQISVANRTRLLDAPWQFRTGRARGFDYGTFGPVDDAIGIRYESTHLPPGDSVAYTSVVALSVGALTDREPIDGEPIDTHSEPDSVETPVETPAEPPVEPESPQQVEPDVPAQIPEAEPLDDPGHAGRVAPDPQEPARSVDEQQVGAAVGELNEAVTELRRMLQTDDPPSSEELEEIRRTIDRLRRERDRLDSSAQ